MVDILFEFVGEVVSMGVVVEVGYVESLIFVRYGGWLRRKV